MLNEVSLEGDLEGDITVPGAPEEDDEPNTIDEPVKETIVSMAGNITVKCCMLCHLSVLSR